MTEEELERTKKLVRALLNDVKNVQVNLTRRLEDARSEAKERAREMS